jgi:hypothetical protein
MSIFKDKKGQTRELLGDDIDDVVRDVLEIRKGELVCDDLIDEVCFDVVERLTEEIDQDFDVAISNN